jgi:hypothetical protein
MGSMNIPGDRRTPCRALFRQFITRSVAGFNAVRRPFFSDPETWFSDRHI